MLIAARSVEFTHAFGLNGSQKFRSSGVIAFEFVVPHMGGAACIHDFKRPLAVFEPINAHLDGRAIPRKLSAQRRVNDDWIFDCHGAHMFCCQC
jgi:hypothetical protein